MPSAVIPIDPTLIIPKPKDTSQKDLPMKRHPTTVVSGDDDPPPDVSDLIDEINERLSHPWQDNEIRCGRGIHFGTRCSVSELREAMKIVSSLKWRVTVTFDHRDGATMTVMPPVAEKKQNDTRGHRGYL